jgi:hypothetical protein
MLCADPKISHGSHRTGVISMKLMCISLYDVNSSDWTAKHSEVLSGQIVLYGGAYRDRTDDPLLAKQVLSQLS